MLLRRFYDDGLAQASYLIGCPAAGEAIVVDANREVEQYVAAADAEQLRITHVTETHIHADYLSGSRELAARTGARLLLSAEGGEDWRYGFADSDHARLLHDGDRIDVGRVRLDVLHTPGHTPEHLVFVVTDTAVSTHPMGILTGDFVFVGDVGRPDLLERAAGMEGTMEASARRLFASLRRLERFPDYLQLWPGHGAGSACGKALGAVPFTTLGYERLVSWAFSIADEEEFVRAVLAGQPEPPAYFARMKRLNRDGPPPRRTTAIPRVTELDRLERLRDAGAWIIDTRPSAAFTMSHMPGTINIPLGTSFVTWAGSLVPDDTEVVLLMASSDPDAAARAARQLMLIGLDAVAAWGSTDLHARWRDSGRTLGATPTIDVETLAAEMAGPRPPRVIDVRGAAEWSDGHIPGAAHHFLGSLLETSRDIPRETPLVVHCQGGTRSSIGASLLRRAGFTNVTNVPGGFDDWRSRGLPIAR